MLAGLALFLSLFIMGPVLTDINDQARAALPERAPWTQPRRSTPASKPLRTSCWRTPGEEDIALMTRAARTARTRPTPTAVPLTTLIPAFVLSELRAAFIIGFVIFIPFLIIDMVVSSALMSLGMMMLPPVMVSLPFKLLLFVLVDGWGLIITSLIRATGAADEYRSRHRHRPAGPDLSPRKLAAPVLLTALGVGFADLAVPVHHPDPGGHALLRAQGR